MCFTQVHGLLRGICWDAIKHDAGQHGTEQQGKTAGNPLNTGESAVRWSVDHRIPEVSVTEIPRCLVEEQITGTNRQWGGELSGGWLLIREISNFSNFITGKNTTLLCSKCVPSKNKELKLPSQELECRSLILMKGLASFKFK